MADNETPQRAVTLLSAKERKIIKAAAKVAGLSLAAYLRHAALKAARDE